MLEHSNWVGVLDRDVPISSVSSWMNFNLHPALDDEDSSIMFNLPQFRVTSHVPPPYLLQSRIMEMVVTRSYIKLKLWVLSLSTSSCIVQACEVKGDHGEY